MKIIDMIRPKRIPLKMSLKLYSINFIIYSSPKFIFCVLKRKKCEEKWAMAIQKIFFFGWAADWAQTSRV